MAQGLLMDTMEVKLEGDYYNVSYGFHQFASFHKDDHLAKRVTITQLANMKIAKTKLSRIFGVHRSSIYLWQETLNNAGMSSLVELNTGPEVKVTQAIKDYVCALHKNLKGKKGMRKTIIKEVENLYGVTISREAIRRAVNERREVEEEITRSKRLEDNTIVEVENKYKEATVKHGGVLLALPLLEKYHGEEIIVAGTRIQNGKYTFGECAYAMFMLLTARLLRVEENIKHFDDEMMGGIIGKERLPSLRTVRRIMSETIENIGQRVEEMKTSFAQSCLSLWQYRNPFYVDGHFFQYGGYENILFGYNTHRRLADKGRTAYVVNTAGRRPIYEVLSDGYDNFIENIERIVDFLIEKGGIERPIIVFDRGAFGWENFRTIEENADFLCWYKGQPAVPDGVEWETVWIPFESNNYGLPEYKAHECIEQVIAKGGEDGKGYRKVFFIKKGQKITPAITNWKEATLEELVLAIAARWGTQENVFKELVIDGFDKIHTYEKDWYTAEYLEKAGLDINRIVENPEYRKLEEERRHLQNKRDLTLGRIARRESESKKTIKPTKTQAQRLEAIEERLDEVSRRLTYLPKNIMRMDYINDNRIKRLSNEKKKYFDLLNFLAYNVRKDMVEIIGPIYKNNRDVHQLVLKILRLSTQMFLGENETRITFTQRLRGREKEALQELCRYATSIGHKSSLFPGALSFRVS